MKQFIVYIILSLYCILSFSQDEAIDHYFKNKTGCFILYDLTHKKLIEKYNPSQCAKRIAADSTFKVPLSLMVFDQHLITQQTLFKWDNREKGLQQWDHDQTPKTWLQYSVVWVSQLLTPKLGIGTIKKYLNEFHYGNQDFSGHPGKQDGLTRAWLSSSLKISADEQLLFLIHFFTGRLPVSNEAIMNTKQNMFLEQSNDGWKLYGKTGSGVSPHGLPEGWFLGMVQKGKRQFVFVTNFTAHTKTSFQKGGGVVAKNITMEILKDEKLSFCFTID